MQGVDGLAPEAKGGEEGATAPTGGAGATFRTPYYHHREQPEHCQKFNRDHARLRALGERAFDQLKSWRLLRRARRPARRIGTIVQAVHTLLTCDYSG